MAEIAAFIILLLFLGTINLFSSKIEKTNMEKRVGILEKKVNKVEKRVDNIEMKIGMENIVKPTPKMTENPLNIVYISKEQLIGASKIGIKLNFKIHNPTRTKINAFLGDIILKDENGSVFYKYKFYYNQPFYPQSYIDAVILIMDTQTKIYLKLLKLNAVKVELLNQKIYSGDEI